jgi:cysteinyl-tRNA synthetase
MALQVYSTLTRKKEPFHKKPGESVSMYVCGPTVYKPSHIGHMVGPVIFDAVKRYLTYKGFEVTWVMNITDVDDKIIRRGRELAIDPSDVARRYERAYLDVMRNDFVDVYARPSDYIDHRESRVSGARSPARDTTPVGAHQ